LIQHINPEGKAAAQRRRQQNIEDETPTQKQAATRPEARGNKRREREARRRENKEREQREASNKNRRGKEKQSTEREGRNREKATKAEVLFGENLDPSHETTLWQWYPR